MPSPMTFDIEEYFEQFADQSAMAEASRFKTVSTGKYKAQATKIEGRYFELKPSTKPNGKSYWSAVFTDDTAVNPSWRKGWQVSFDLLSESGKKMSTVRIDVSWESARNDKGYLDQLFTRYNQLSKAMFPNLKDDERSKKSHGELAGNLKQFPVTLYVTESYKVTAVDNSTKWTTANSDEEAKTFREAGYEPKNFVQSVSRA